MADGDRARRPSRPHLVLIAGVLVLSAAIAGGVWVYDSAARGTDPRLVGAREWRTVSEPALTQWPTTGNRRGDRGLIRRAAGAWRQPDEGQSGPRGEVTVLFAGDIEDRRVVVMRDESDDLDSRGLARYVEDPGNGAHSLTAVQLDDAGGFAPEVIGLIGTARGVRYLLPPWLTNVRVAELSAPQPAPRPLRVRGGVTAPIALADAHDVACRGIALQAGERWASGPVERTFVSTVAVKDPKVAIPDVALLSDQTRDGVTEPVSTPRQWQAVKGAACHESPAMFSAGHINVWQVWHGRLPHGGEDAAAEVAEVQSREDGTDTFGLFTVAGKQSGGVAGTRYAGEGAPDGALAIVGAQWQAPSGRWYYAAVGNEHIDRIEIAGPPSAREHHGRLVLVPAPGDDRPPIAITGYDGEHHAISTTLF
ncbi:hypothetical protein [Actinoallomurus acaciae]|uniref:Uncharacterized protein n=1 Tax=Actinoallomurus acaciae TaxID=502577 RepID=A0ABV5YNS2_9ACTN